MLNKTVKDPENIQIGVYEGKEINLEKALTVVEFGNYNRAITFASGLILFAVNTTLYGVAYILPSAACDLNLNTYQKGLFTGISLFGIIVSLYVWGAIADISGRRKVILTSLVLSFVFNTISVFIDNFWMFCVLQFLKGFFVSGCSSTLYAYLGEFHSNDRRATAVAWCTVYMALGITALPLMAWIILTQPFKLVIFGFILSPWRLYLFLICLPNILAAIPIFILPESPKYLLLQNELPEVMKILNKMYIVNTNRSADTFPIYEITKNVNNNIEACEVKQNALLISIVKKLWRQTSPLFNYANIKYTAATCLFQGILFCTSSGLLMWYPYVLHQIAESTTETTTTELTICGSLGQVGITHSKQNSTLNCDGVLIDEENIIQNTIIGVSYIVGCSLISVLINLLGRRLLLLINTLTPAVCCILLVFVKQEIIVRILFGSLLIFPGLIIGVIASIILDIFPTQVKAMAVSLSLIMGRLGGALTGTFTGLLLEWNCEGSFYFFASLLIVGTLLTLILPIKSLSKS